VTSRLSVVIATRDRPEALARCLDSLTAVADGSIAEVIVVDDGSAMAASAAIDRVQRPNQPVNILTVRLETSQGPSNARNAGARRASGPLLWFIDDDAVVRADTPRVLLQKSTEYPDAVLGGAISMCSLSSAPVMCGACEVDRSLRIDRDRRCQANEVWGCNLLIPRAVFERAGGFSADALIYGEEIELLDRIALRHEIWQVAGAPVDHLRSAEDLTMRALLRRHWIRGRNQARNARRFGWPFPPASTHMRRVVTKSRHALGSRCFGGVMDAVTSLARALPVRDAHRPLKSGDRLARNAATPSRKSSLP